MASNDLDRGGETDARSLAGKESSASLKGLVCSPCRIDCSRTKKVDEEAIVHDNHSLPSHTQCGENSKGHDIEKVDGHTPLSPNQEVKLLGRKYSKRPAGIPSKRPRANDADNCMKESGNGGIHHGISSKAGLDLVRCTLADKSQIVKLKRANDGKKTDKKLFRANVKSKYESLTSKAILTCSDTFSGGVNIHGMHGFKSDLHDGAYGLDELSLCELLDGSYKAPKFPIEKGKKSSNLNDNILHLVRKACSIVCPPHGVSENGSNVKASQSSQDPNFLNGSGSDCETKNKQLNELLTKGKSQECLQANWSEFTVLHPKKILEQLGLSAAHELEAFLLNSTATSISEQRLINANNDSYIGMPPFPWSFSHGGNGKPGVECSKINSTKSSCQGKWIRIGNNSTSAEDGKNIWLGLVSKEHGHNADSSSQPKIDDVLQLIKSFTLNSQLPSDGASDDFALGTHPEAKVSEILNLAYDPGVSDSFNLKACQQHKITQCLNCTCLDSNSKEHTSGVISWCEITPDTSKFSSASKDKTVMLESKTGICDGCSVNSVKSGSNCCPCQSSNWEKYRNVYTPELLTAAETLYQMARISDPSIAAANHSNERIRWPKAPPMKPMKARKSPPSMDKFDRSFPSSGYGEPIKQADSPSAKHQPASEKKANSMRPSSSGREAIRWPSIAAPASTTPHKFENQRLPHGNSAATFVPSSSPFSSRPDKAYGSQNRRAPPKYSAAAFEGSFIRDWIRGRNKRQ